MNKLANAFGLFLIFSLFTLEKCAEIDNTPHDRCRGLEEALAGSRERINCKYDPDDYLDVPQMIRRHGYPAETHIVQSEDGYLTGVHRIAGSKSGKKGGQPVFLQHGLLGSSADWILDGNNSLGYVLADQGYDVWLGNARGNIYSRAHVSLPIYSAAYWNFSWHDMATEDIPAVLYYIGNITGHPGEIIYIGHSMGTTISFVLSSTLPQVAKTLKLVVCLAPTAYMTHLKSPIRYLAPFVDDLQWLAKHTGLNMFEPSNKLLKFLSYECEKNCSKKICENLMFLLSGGINMDEINLETLPTIFSHDPAGASTKTLLHYAQEIKNDGKFQQYDYGPNGNMIKYGTKSPPEYDLSKIKRPFYLFYAENDALTNEIDVLRLSKKLFTLVGLYKVPMQTFGHIGFIFGKDAYKLVYEPLLNVLRNFTMY